MTPQQPTHTPVPEPESIHGLRDELLHLRQQHQRGELNDADHSARKELLERKLLDLAMLYVEPAPAENAAPAPAAPPPPARRQRKSWPAAGAVLLCAGVLVYSWVRAPGGDSGARASNAASNAAGSSTLANAVSSSMLAGVTGTIPPGSANPHTTGNAALMAAHPGAVPAQAASAPHAMAGSQVQDMVAKLAARLQAQPDDAEGWAMLGRSYMALKRPVEATEAYARALKLKPDDAATWADQADAWAAKNGGALEGEPSRLVQRALQLEPGNLKALMLAGTGAFNRADWKLALQHWDRAVQLGPADHPMVVAARAGALEARQRLQAPGAGAAAIGGMMGTQAPR